METNGALSSIPALWRNKTKSGGKNTLKPDTWCSNQDSRSLSFRRVALGKCWQCSFLWKFAHVHLQHFSTLNSFFFIFKPNHVKANMFQRKLTYFICSSQEWCCTVRWRWQVSGSSGRHRWRETETENVRISDLL